MNTQYTNGYVTLPIEKYHALVDQANASQALLNNLVKIKENYRETEIEVVIDEKQIYNKAVELLAKDPELRDCYEPTDVKQFNAWASSFAYRKPEAVDVEE